MAKTLGDLGTYLMEILPSDLPNDSQLATTYIDVYPEEDIKSGLKAFRAFLLKMCQAVKEDDLLGKQPIKGSKKFGDELTLTQEFPFFNNLKSILINVGRFGHLADEATAIVVESWDQLSLKSSLNKSSTTKLSLSQMKKTLVFLSTCGLIFDGVNLEKKKLDPQDIETITISYPGDPLMLLGWKVLSKAQEEKATRQNDDILLRYDVGILAKDEDQVDRAFKDYIKPLATSLQEELLTLHHHYVARDMKCHVEKGFFCTHFVYSYKKKPLWRFSRSFHQGFRLVAKTKHTEKLVSDLPTSLQAKLAKGYGCDRKQGTGHGNCQKGCEGFSFALDETFVTLARGIQDWQDLELQAM